MKKVMLLCLLFVCGSANAAYWQFFNNSSGDTLWCNPANWDNAEVPTIANTDYAAGMCYGSTTMLKVDCYAECRNMITGVWGAENNMEITENGYLYLSNEAGDSGLFSIGEGTTEAGALNTVTNNGGTIYLAGQMFIGGSSGGGNGSYVQNAGSFTSGWRVWVSAADDIQLNGGTMTAGTVQVDATGLVDFSGGDMYFGGYSPEDGAALVQSYILDGRMTAYDGTGIVKYAFDEDPAVWKMHVWGVVPEPATMGLLALGGLLLRRRK